MEESRIADHYGMAQVVDRSYRGLRLLCASLVVATVFSSALVPIANLTQGEYQNHVLLAVFVYSPVLLIINRTWFRVSVGIFLAVWALFLLVGILWGSLSLLLVVLPVPLAVAWFLPPAPIDRHTFLTFAGTGVVVMLFFASMLALISRNDGGTLYLCANGPVESSVLAMLGEEDPRGGYGLPDGVISMRSTRRGYAFHFAPFTQQERDVLTSKAEQTEWVTEVRVNEAC